MLQVQNVIVSFDILTKEFSCDLNSCRGACCIEGDAGAPVTTQEIEQIEKLLPVIWDRLSPQAQQAIKEKGLCYNDPDGELVTQIVGGKDCVFTCRGNDGCCYCAIEKAYREGKTDFMKPVSCHLYPIRVVKLGDNWGLNYNRWDICKWAVIKGRKEHSPLYKYLKEPLIRRFGKEWYEELEFTVREMIKQDYL